jgi:hypothetical protein
VLCTNMPNVYVHVHTSIVLSDKDKEMHVWDSVEAIHLGSSFRVEGTFFSSLQMTLASCFV